METVQFTYDEMLELIGKKITVRKDHRNRLYMDADGKNVAYLEADEDSPMLAKIEFINELMKYDFEWIKQFVGKHATPDDWDWHQESMRQQIGKSYDEKTRAELLAFTTEMEMRARGYFK